MKVNECETRFCVIHGTPGDNEAMHIEGLVVERGGGWLSCPPGGDTRASYKSPSYVVERCTLYIYMGSQFTANGSV